MSDVNAGTVKATIEGDASGLEAAVDRALDRAASHIDNTINTTMNRAEGRITSGFKSIGNKIAGFFTLDKVIQGASEAIGYIARLGTEYESGLNTFRAVSGATEEQMKAVSDEAVALGDDLKLPGVSAADASGAMTELAKAGFDVQEAMDAARGSLELATAAQTDGATAAHIEAESINAFNLKAEDAAHVADVLANAANESAADIEGIADSMQQAGSVAHAAGFSIDETAAAIAVMANNSIQGSDAGTSLKSMLVQLQAPSQKAADLMKKLGINVYDNQGNMLSLSEIIDVVAKGTEGLTQKQRDYALATIFGTDAIRAINVLLNAGSHHFDEMAESIDREGGAAGLAAANSKGLVGSLNALQSMLESVAIEIYNKVSPALDEFIRGGLDKAPDLLEKAGEYAEDFGEALEPLDRLIEDVIAAAAPGIAQGFGASLEIILKVVQALDIALEPLADLVDGMGDSFDSIVGPIAAAAVALYAWSKAVKVVTSMKASVVTNMTTAWGSLDSQMGRAVGTANRMKIVGGNLFAAMGGPWGVAIAAVSIAIGIFAQKSEEAAQAQAELDAQAEQVADTLNEQTGALTKNTEAQAEKMLADRGVYDAATQVGIGLGEVTQAALGNKDAYKEVFASASAVIEKYGLLSDQGYAAAHVMKDVATIAGSLADRQHEIAQSNLAAAEMSQHYTTSAAQQARINAELARGEERAASEADHQKRSTDALTKSLLKLHDATIKNIGGEIGLQQAIDDADKEIHKGTKTLDIHTQAGRDNMTALLDIASAAGDVTGSAKKQEDAMELARRKIVQFADDAGYTQDQAEDLADKLFKVKEDADKIPNSVSVHVSAPGAGETQSALEAAAREAARLDGTTISLSFVAGSMAHEPGHGAESNQAPGHAFGGAVIGPGGPMSDSILRRLSNGEHVITAEEVAMAGGQGAIYAMREAIRAGRSYTIGGGSGGGGALVDNLSVTVADKRDLSDALDEVEFHLRRIGRGGVHSGEHS